MEEKLVGLYTAEDTNWDEEQNFSVSWSFERDLVVSSEKRLPQWCQPRPFMISDSDRATHNTLYCGDSLLGFDFARSLPIN